MSRPVKVFCWLGWNDPLGQRTDHGLRRRGRTGVAAEAPAAPAGPAPPAATATRRHRGRRPPAGREHQLELAVQPRRAGVPLGRVGLLSGGAQRTAATSRVPTRLLAVADVRARRLDGQPDPVQRGEEPVAAAVSGEDAPGPVAAVRRRGESHDQDGGLLGAPAGDRAPPVRLVGEGPALVAGDLLAPGHQTRTGPAPGHRCLEVAQVGRPDGVRLNVAGALRDRCGHRGADALRAGPEQVDRAAPGLLAVTGVVDLGPLVVEERVVRAGVVVDLDVAAGLLDPLDGGLDPVGARGAVLLRGMDHRGLVGVAAPRRRHLLPRHGRVEADRDLDLVGERAAPQGERAAHAEADGADPVAGGLVAAVEVLRRALDVLGGPVHGQTHEQPLRLVGLVGLGAVEEVRARRRSPPWRSGRPRP